MKPSEIPAFPLSKGAALHPVTDMYGRDVSSGMTLRDYFAAHAIEAATMWLNQENRFLDFDNVARVAFGFADAMLKSRELAKQQENA